MREIIDNYCWENHKKVLTYEQHQVNGLKNVAYWNLSRANPKTPWHHHSDIVEIHCLIKGKWYSQVKGSAYEIKGNELFITFPFEEHSNENLPQCPCSFYGFQIDLKRPENLLGLNAEYSRALCDILLNLKDRHLKYTPNHANLLKQAFTLLSKNDASDTKIGVQYLCSFLFDLGNLEPVSKTQVTKVDPYIQRTIDFIEVNFKENIKLKDLAAIAGYSLSRFKNKFKDEVGITPAEFITLRKIEYAKFELKNTNISISDLAFEIGFSSSNYFSFVFNRMSNYTPSDFRQICRDSASEQTS